MLFWVYKLLQGTFRYFRVLQGTLSIFGYFWVFLGIFGYFWVHLGILGIVLYRYCFDIVSILYQHCINTYRAALGQELFCSSFPDARDCCPLGLLLFHIFCIFLFFTIMKHFVNRKIFKLLNVLGDKSACQQQIECISGFEKAASLPMWRNLTKNWPKTSKRIAAIIH